MLNLVYAIIIFSCANPVSPTGGPKDETPPQVIDSEPPNWSINFNSKNIKIDFDEYVELNNPNEQVIISPPLDGRPVYKLKGHSVVIEFEDTLRLNTTYSFFFGDAIVDITERNPLTNWQYIFSTGEHLDSLSFEGYIVDAYTLEPVENIWVMLYTDTRDSVPYLERPFYVARSGVDGYFRFYNLSDHNFKLFALADANNNYLYDMPNETIAFADSLVSPFYDNQTVDIITDSLIPEAEEQREVTDSLVPEPQEPGEVIMLKLFQEIDSTQAIADSKLVEEGHIRIIFMFPTIETQITPINWPVADQWYLEEFNKRKDTLNIWLIERVPDTLELEIADNNIVLDTIKFIRRKTPTVANDEEQPVERIKLSSNASMARPLEVNTPFVLKSAFPIKEYDFSGMIFIANEDTLPTPTYQFHDSIHKKIRIDHHWKPMIQYFLMIPDSSIFDIRGLTNDTIWIRFQTRSPEDYGSLILDFSVTNQEIQYIVQLLSEKESILVEYIIDKNYIVEFPDLNPGNYKVKVIYDRNKNGRWDTGDYLKAIQPEEVKYFPKLINIRENWISEELWEL